MTEKLQVDSTEFIISSSLNTMAFLKAHGYKATTGKWHTHTITHLEDYRLDGRRGRRDLETQGGPRACTRQTSMKKGRRTPCILKRMDVNPKGVSWTGPGWRKYGNHHTRKERTMRQTLLELLWKVQHTFHTARASAQYSLP